MRTPILLLVASSVVFAAGEGPARAWVDQVTLPTWLEGPANPNPPFDQFAGDGPFIYPYTSRTQYTQTKVNHGWRALFLENDYLKCTILPDLGGHLMCTDKVNGREMFYSNPSIKKQSVALRGAWIATGEEFNFPLGHTLVSVSPVDFAVRQNPDGSASAWISSIDRLSGMSMNIEFVLTPGSSLLTQRVTLANPSSVRHRYYWWANAEVQVEDNQTTAVMPTYVVQNPTAGLDEWPVSAAGVHLDTFGGQKEQNSLFAYQSKEPFMGMYHARSRTGVAHYSAEALGKKVWTWGTAATFPRTELADNNTTYMEIQAGLGPNQETYFLMNPQEVRHFTEYWMPVRSIGGISRATSDGVLNQRRSPAANGKVTITAEFLPTHAAAGAAIRLVADGKVVQETKADLTPQTPAIATFADVPADPHYVLEVLDAKGAILMHHSEEGWDARKADGLKLGPEAKPSFSNPLQESDFLAAVAHWETEGNFAKVVATLQQGLVAYAQSAALHIAAGRTAVEIGNFQEGIEHLSAALKFRQDAEARYYLGVAQENVGNDIDAKASFAKVSFAAVQDDSPFSRAAKFRTAQIQARAGDHAGALATLQAALGTSADWPRMGAAEVALLRKLGRQSDAQTRLAFWLNADPSDLLLRFERHQLAPSADDSLYFRQLASDPERVLDVATHLFELGLYEDALVVLERRYNEIVDPLDVEPGRVAPQNYPLVSYYRAYASEKIGRASAADEYKAASAQSIQYVFPNRPGSAAVLTAAVARDPGDATAHALLGSLWFSFRRTDDAIAEWKKARSLNKNLPMLQRNLGRALLEAKNDPRSALPVLEEGLKIDPNNPEIQAALSKAQEQAKSSPDGGKRKK